MVQATDSAAPTYAAISADYYQSCKRSRIWELTGTWLPRAALAAPTQPAFGQLSLNDAAKLSPALRAEYEKEAAAYIKAMKDYNAKLTDWNKSLKQQEANAAQSAASPLPTYIPPAPSKPPTGAPTSAPETPPPFGGGDVCAPAAYASQQWQKLNVVLISYVDALGRLAAVGNGTSSTYGFDTLGNSLTASNVMSSAQVTAVQSALTSVANGIFAAKSRDEIAKYAPQAQQGVDTIIDALEYAADVDYRGLLDIERIDINEFYQNNVRVTTPGLQVLETLPYRQEWVGDIAALDQKVAAINAYRVSLEALRSAHAAIVKESAAHNVDLTSTATTFIAQYLPSLEAIDKAFSSTPKTNATPTPKPKGA
jgi:hypothetical protein